MNAKLPSNIYIQQALLSEYVSKSLSMDCATQEFLNIKRKPCTIYNLQFTVVMIPRYYVIYDLPNMSIQKSAYQDSDSDSDSDVSRALSVASSVSTYRMKEKQDKGTKNVVERNNVFHTQQLEESFKMEHLTELKREIGLNSAIPLRIKDIISEVKIMKHLIQLSQLQGIRRNPTEIQSNSRQKEV